MESSRAQAAANLLEATRENERLKSTLLDALAHEFKTPLTSVKAAATTLLAHLNGNALHRELLTVIDEESNRLITLVNDAIELARIDIAEVDLNKEVCLPTQLVHAATEELRPVLDERPVHIAIDEDAEPVFADSRLTQLVLRQLLINAIRYSPTGSTITIKVQNHYSETVFRIKNAGYGIPRSEQKLIFQKFYRGKQARGRTAGTGMGLSIAREIIEAHGGQIWVESEVNEGAELFFTLPVAVREPVTVAAQGF
jgi:two-component system sensor histidine kinase KdpD